MKKELSKCEILAIRACKFNDIEFTVYNNSNQHDIAHIYDLKRMINKIGG